MADQYDITSESMDITPTRQKQVAFADGWLESGARIVTRKDTGIKGPEDLKGRNVGALSASTFGKLAEEHGATLKSYKTAADAMQDLVGGNIDAVINDAVAGNYAIKARKLPLVMIETPLSTVQKASPSRRASRTCTPRSTRPWPRWSPTVPTPNSSRR